MKQLACGRCYCCCVGALKCNICNCFLFFFFSLVDLETTLLFKANFIVNHTSNSCLKPKAIMMKDLDGLSTSRSGTKTVETRILYGSSDDSGSK